MLPKQVIWSAVLAVTISVAINATFLTGTERQMKDEILHGFRQFDETGRLTPELSIIMKQIPLSSISGLTSSSTSPVTRESLTCLACLAAVDIMKIYIDTHTRDQVYNLVVALCLDLTDYKEEVCLGSVGLHLDPILYIYKHTANLPAARLCGIVFQGSQCFVDEPSLEWSIDIDPGSKSEDNRIEDKKAHAASPLTIIQLSDIHQQEDYLPGGNAACGLPICCRINQGPPPSPDAAAGYWGNGGCDIPMHHFENTLKQIKNTHENIDFIYITGDIVDRVVWDTKIPTNIGVLTNITERLLTTFPNTPVYTVFGNHEPSPLNVFAPHYITDETVSVNWLYNLSINLWSHWLPPETNETILRGGYYTALAKPGFRIIGLNNNVCYPENWWMIHNPKDQDGQLQWLADTLLQAEKNGEKVHILGHITSDQCFRTWAREFRRIVSRFENTITAIFKGHTHSDQFNVYYSFDRPGHATGVAFNGASVTPGPNSNYKVYTVDPNNYTVLNSESWMYILTDANKNPSEDPSWYQAYSFKDVFGVQSMSAIEMGNLTHTLAKNRPLLEEYAR
ncbi:sphingomyelin phosphodiesterase [Cryptotermes secundus]|nr:sphingomyelin phosphodiesterase [Cryptotermes secundus]